MGIGTGLRARSQGLTSDMMGDGVLGLGKFVGVYVGIARCCRVLSGVAREKRRSSAENEWRGESKVGF